MNGIYPVITRVDANTGNPGDGFIRWGLQWLLEEAYQHPINWLLISKFSKKDLKKHEHRVREAGFVIYAGTPQYNNYDDWKLWYDDDMYRLLRKWRTRVYSIAGGAGVPHTAWSPAQFAAYCIGSEETCKVLRRRKSVTRLFTVRDPYAHELLNKMSIMNYMLPCTATWASHYHGIQKASNDFVALVPPSLNIMAPHEAKAKNKDDVRLSLLNTYKLFKSEFEKRFPNKRIIIVSHHLNEYNLFKKYIDNDQLFYSNDAHSLLKFYSHCEYVVSGRLHGALPAYGIPGTKVGSISIDTRGAAATLLPDIVSIKYRLVARDRKKISEAVDKIVDAKASTPESLKKFEKQYMPLLRKIK